MIGKRLLCLIDVLFCIEDDVSEGFCIFSDELLEYPCEDRKEESFNITDDAVETIKLNCNRNNQQ